MNQTDGMDVEPPDFYKRLNALYHRHPNKFKLLVGSGALLIIAILLRIFVY